MDERHDRFMKYFLPVAETFKAYLLAAVGNMNDMDDLFQEVSTVLWRLFDRYDERLPFRNWGLGIARLEILKWKQRHARSHEVLSEETISALAQTATESAEELDLRARHLPDCVRKLPKKARLLVRLRYYQALTIGKIGAELGMSEGATEVALVRVRNALKICVERTMRLQRS